MSGVFDYVVNKNIETAHRQFWGRYAALNDATPPVPSGQMIHEYQLNRIKAAEENIAKASAARSAKFNKISELILNNDQAAMWNYENQLDSAMGKAINAIFENIRDIRAEHNLYSGGKKADGTFASTEERKANVQRVQQMLVGLHRALTKLQNDLNVKEKAYEDNLNQILAGINALENATGSAFNRVAFQQFWNRLSNIQGDLLEELGTAWFNQRIPKDLNVKMVTTGNVALSGHGQLIQDMMVINWEHPDIIANINISFTIGGKSYTQPIQQFLTELPKYNGSSKIMLDDNAYGVLQSVSVLNIQAKSGKNQLPWNVNKSTEVAISQYADDTEGMSGNLSVLRTFKLLIALDDERPHDKWMDNKDVGQYYQALANYGLATALYKVLHLDAEQGNQYLLTPDGFMKFSERFIQLFKKTPNGYVRLKGRVFMNGRFNPITTPYAVDIPLYWR